MNTLRSAVLSGVLAGVVTSAFAGAGEVIATITPLSDTVTYAAAATPGAPALVTYVGYEVSLANRSTNTINFVSFNVSVVATDRDETVELFNAAAPGPDPDLPSDCTQTSVSELTCIVGTMRSGGTFPASGKPFVVFYKAPVKVDGNGRADAPGTDFVQANVHVVFAEGNHDQPRSVPRNSTRDWPAKPVTLGTVNPVDVRTALPAIGGTFFTGTGGIPTGENRLAEVLAVPPRSAATSGIAAIHISKVPDTDYDEPQCGALGHFRECPIYTTTVTGTFPEAPWLTTVYRIDASNLKMAPWKILNSALLTYTNENVSSPVHVCVNNEPTSTGVPCILRSRCYKKGSPGWTPELDGDCEWTLINKRNGSLIIQ